MEVIALVGPSGTGKSHRAITIAHELNADLIIDDGLLIQGSRILAGISAKRQLTKIGAVKTALFNNEQHRQQAEKLIRELSPKRILVLGTSSGMILRITQRLELPEPEQILRIEDVASKDEIRKARYYRGQLGKHVIPAPTMEVKRKFPNTLIDSLYVVLQGSSKQKVYEQSVIRPTYSYLGKFTISENVIIQLTERVVEAFACVAKTGKVKAESDHGNTLIELHYSAYHGFPLHLITKEIQAKVREEIETYTGLNVTAVNVVVAGLVVKRDLS